MFKFNQKDTEYFDLFVESARYFYNGALMMDEVMLDYSKAADKVREIVELEHEADAVNDKIIDKLNILLTARIYMPLPTAWMTGWTFCRGRCSVLSCTRPARP